MNDNIETMIQKMIANLENSLEDARKFDRGNKSAGVRVRKAMQEAKNAAQSVRERISEIKNAE